MTFALVDRSKGRSIAEQRNQPGACHKLRPCKTLFCGAHFYQREYKPLFPLLLPSHPAQHFHPHMTNLATRLAENCGRFPEEAAIAATNKARAKNALLAACCRRGAVDGNAGWKIENAVMSGLRR